MSKFDAKTAYNILWAFEMVVQSEKSDYVGMDMHPNELAKYRESFLQLLSDRGETELHKLMSDSELMWEQQ